jgi:hypothetical protein
MQFVGRKLYTAADDNLVVSISELTAHWSRFQHAPGKVFFQTAQLADLLGEIFPLGQGPFECYEGEEAAGLLRDLETWLTASLNSGDNPDWIMGRRLVAGWKPNGMIALEGLQVPPAKYGLTNNNVVLFDLFEFDGVLMEMWPQILEIEPDGPLTGIINNNRYWITERDFGKAQALTGPTL